MKKTVIAVMIAAIITACLTGCTKSQPEKTVDTISFEKPVFLSEEQLTFRNDSAIIMSEKAMLETLTPVYEYMNSHPGFSLLICGLYDPSDISDYGQGIRELRAELIADMLIEMGTDSDRVETTGLSPDNPFYNATDGPGSNDKTQHLACVLIDASAREEYGLP